MTPYLIFAAVLTVAYIIYYGYNISKDLYGKRGLKSDTEETFDISAMANGIVATPVQETSGGFSVGGDNVEMPPAEPSPSEQPTQNVENGQQPNPQPANPLEDVTLEEAEVESEGGMDYTAMSEWIRSRHKTEDLIREKIKVERERY